MKVLAIGSLVKPLSEQERDEILPREVPHTLQLYLDGIVDQFWFRQDQPGPIFLLNVESVDRAKTIVEAMPLMLFADDPEQKLGEAFCLEALGRGVYLHHRHNMFLSLAHTPEVIDTALAATEDAFAALARSRPA